MTNTVTQRTPAAGRPPTRRAIFILRVQLGPEFFMGKRWFSIMSLASSRRLRGSVNVPKEHSCFSSFTYTKIKTSAADTSKNLRSVERRAEQLSDDLYLHLQLLGFGVVDEEGEGFLPHGFISLISDLEEDTNKEE